MTKTPALSLLLVLTLALLPATSVQRLSEPLPHHRPIGDTE